MRSQQEELERWMEWFHSEDTQDFLFSIEEEIAESLIEGTADVLDHNMTIYNSGKMAGLQRALEKAYELVEESMDTRMAGLGKGILVKLRERKTERGGLWASVFSR